MAPRGKPGQSLVTLDYLFARTRQVGDCWEWTNSRHRQGYGMVRDPHRNRTNVAHRVVYELVHGVHLERRQVVRHSCDNPPCINPDHLLIGTQVDNMRDASARRRFVRQRIPFSRIPEIRAPGADLHQIAREIGCSYSSVYDVAHGRSYGWVA